MKRRLSPQEIERRFAEINEIDPVELAPEEEASLAAAEEMDDGTYITLDEYRETRQYSGKLLLRIPKELHKELAELAKLNGVSINQYAVYKLSKS